MPEVSRITAPKAIRYMPYEWAELPDPLPFQWAPYAEMFREFSRELANIINSLTQYTHQLTAWRDLLENLDDDVKHSVAIEFIDPLATIALNLPYVIRSRFIFASAHLNHQANRSKVKKGWKDDLSLDNEIYLAQAEEAGKPWRAWGKLKTKLERISDKAYVASTRNFRHTYNHRFSPRIVIGQTGAVTRIVNADTKQVSYSFGGIDPLTLDLVVTVLEEQCQRIYQAFDAFQKLVHEQSRAIAVDAAESFAAMAAAQAARQKSRAATSGS